MKDFIDDECIPLDQRLLNFADQQPKLGQHTYGLQLSAEEHSSCGIVFIREDMQICVKVFKSTAVIM
eukprot:5691756-Karenia_brevis.AAC.1